MVSRITKWITPLALLASLAFNVIQYVEYERQAEQQGYEITSLQIHQRFFITLLEKAPFSNQALKTILVDLVDQEPLKQGKYQFGDLTVCMKEGQRKVITQRDHKCELAGH